MRYSGVISHGLKPDDILCCKLDRRQLIRYLTRRLVWALQFCGYRVSCSLKLEASKQAAPADNFQVNYDTNVGKNAIWQNK